MRKLPTDKKQLALDVVAKMLEEFADSPISNGEKIIAFDLTVYVADKSSIQQRGMTLGAFDVADARFRLAEIRREYEKRMLKMEVEAECPDD